MKFDQFPPRGSRGRDGLELPASQYWHHPGELDASWNWRPGRVLLGHWQGRSLGIEDDRHIATIAGARSGKSTTVLIPNLRRYPGSAIVLDPKGELTRACANARRKMGQRVYVLDPFGETDEVTSAHNPFAELGRGKAAHVAADAAQMADAVIISNDRDPHWTDSAKNLIRGITLDLMSASGVPTMRAVRRLLNGTPAELEKLFEQMIVSSAFEGVVANIGASFLGKSQSGGRELQSILSTAQEQTAPLDDIMGCMDRSDFDLGELRDGNMTLFLVLPGMRMGTHYRWLRLVIQQALAAVERAPVARGGLPVWFVLEEFPVLGHMRSLETAAGLMSGFGVKLWSVMQDLTQLKTAYAKSWETFLGNAGVIQAFGNADVTTTEHLSKLLGSVQITERQDVQVSSSAMGHGDMGRREHLRNVRLLEPFEITQMFARETKRQLIFVPGRHPAFMERLSRDADIC